MKEVPNFLIDRKNMFDCLVENDVPGVYASAHGGHHNLKSKEIMCLQSLPVPKL